MPVEFSSQIKGPIAVIGDVHGQIKQLLTILDKLRALPDYERRWVVFIGDLVDRGPDPKAAIDIYLELLNSHPRTTCVAGNHELAMAGALKLVPVPDYSDWGDRWVENYGAETTFASYGVPFGNLPQLAAALSAEHQEFLRDLPWCVEHPEYFFVHAGLDPHTSFAGQLPILRQRDFSLNRPQWLCSKTFPFADLPDDCRFTVISGHVPVPEVQFARRRILIDTTGGCDGNLSCVLLPENRVITSDPAPVAATPAPKRRFFGML